MAVAKRYLDALTEDGRYRLLVDAITDYAVYMLDITGVVTSWNPGAQRFKGYAAPEIIGKHFAVFYTDEDQKAELPAFALERSAATGTFHGEGWRVRKDGSHFWASVVIDPIRDNDGALVGFAKVTRDLTERKLAEDRAKLNECQFTLLVQSVTGYAIYRLDPKGRINSWNAGATRIKGYSAHEVTGRDFAMFYTAADQANHMPQRALDIAARDGRFVAEGWRVRRNGDVFWADIVIDAIFDQNGLLLGFAKITRDLTDSKKAQVAVEAARDALLQSQKMEAIGHLTGGVAHDFNNLLTVILGGLEIIQRRLPEDPTIKSLLENAMRAAVHGKSLTERMLAFARRQRLKPALIRIPALIGGMTDLLQRTLGPSVTVETEFPSQLPAVVADPNQLELAVINLAMNARDAMPDGGLITISAKHLPTASGRGVTAGEIDSICLTVSDWGDGMDAATLGRAIEPFFTTKGVGKGTGLGLSMVHGFAEQSNGHFVLKSQLGQGTVAELWLPAAPDHVDKTEVPKAKDTTACACSGTSRAVPPVVLAVNDDRLALMNTAAMLNDLGYRVYSATSAKQALSIIRKDVMPDLVIIDQSMPDMNGLELSEAIKNEWPDIRVIFVTSETDLIAQLVPKLKLQTYLETANPKAG